MATPARRNVTTHAAPSQWPEEPEPSPWDHVVNMFSGLFGGEEGPAPAAAEVAQPAPVDGAGAESTPAATPAPPAATPAPPAAVPAEPKPLAEEPVATGSAPPPPAEPQLTPAPKFSLDLSTAPPPMDKNISHELAGAGNYMSWRDEMVKLVSTGKKPPATLLTLLEAALYKLGDDDLRDEYRWYAEQYTSDESSDAMRTACEMIVIRIGEIVEMPQGARVAKRKSNKRLLEAQVTPRMGQVTFDPEVKGGGAEFQEYAALRDQMIAQRKAGRSPGFELYTEVDYRLAMLPGQDQLGEYVLLAKLYLDEGVEVAVRGFCEVRLARLGELLYQPLATRQAICRQKPLLAQLEGQKPHIAAAALGRKDDVRGEPLAPPGSAAHAAAAAALMLGGQPPLLGPDGYPVIGPDGKPLPATTPMGPGGVPLGPDGKPLFLGPDGTPLTAEMMAAAGKAAYFDNRTMPPGWTDPNGPPPGQGSSRSLMSKAAALLSPGSRAKQEAAAAAAGGPAPATPSGAPGAAPPSTPGTGFMPGATSYTPGKLPGWVTQDEAWGKQLTAGVSGMAQMPGKLPPGAPGMAKRGGASLLGGGGDDGGDGGPDGKRENWFQRMRQREHLGGKKRDAQQLSLMALHDELAVQVASHGASLLKKGGSAITEIATEGTDSRIRETYAKPEEYLAQQDALVNELATFLRGGQDGMRAKLKKTEVKRALPWQDAINENPQQRLKRTGRLAPTPIRGGAPLERGLTGYQMSAQGPALEEVAKAEAAAAGAAAASAIEQAGAPAAEVSA